MVWHSPGRNLPKFWFLSPFRREPTLESACISMPANKLDYLRCFQCL